jgi:hypothetical protein
MFFCFLQIAAGLKQGDVLMPVQDVTTRWNSTYYMVERIVELKPHMCVFMGMSDAIPQLTHHEWDLLDKLIKLLLPFSLVTKEVRNNKLI